MPSEELKMRCARSAAKSDFAPELTGTKAVCANSLVCAGDETISRITARTAEPLLFACAADCSGDLRTENCKAAIVCAVKKRFAPALSDGIYQGVYFCAPCSLKLR